MLAFFATFLFVLVPVGVLVMFVGALLVLIRILHALFGKKDDAATRSDIGRGAVPRNRRPASSHRRSENRCVTR